MYVCKNARIFFRLLVSKLAGNYKMLMTYCADSDCNNHKHFTSERYATYKSIVHLKKERNEMMLTSRQVFPPFGRFFRKSIMPNKYLPITFLHNVKRHDTLQIKVCMKRCVSLFFSFCYIFSSHFPLVYPTVCFSIISTYIN